MQPVKFTAPIYLYPDRSQALAAGALEGQQAFDSLGNQPGAEPYLESQESGTRIHTDTGDLDSILNSSAETLLNTPKTPDTSFESRQLVAQPVVGAPQADARPDLGERKQPNQRGLEQEGDNIPSEVRQQRDSGKATQPLSEPHPEGRDKRQPAPVESSSSKKEAAPPMEEAQPKAQIEH